MKSGWMKGTMILTITAFFVKLLSLLYKVPYQNISGDEGLYVFQQVYPLIGILYDIKWSRITNDYCGIIINVSI